MTREEAIEALGLAEHVESIVATYEPGETGNNTTVRELKEACRMGASALRAQQEPVKLDRSRWEGCSECSKPWCITCVRYDSRSTGTPCTTSCIGYSKHESVKFCKNCGRPLTEEAWAELERRINGRTTD